MPSKNEDKNTKSQKLLPENLAEQIRNELLKQSLLWTQQQSSGLRKNLISRPKAAEAEVSSSPVVESTKPVVKREVEVVETVVKVEKEVEVVEEVSSLPVLNDRNDDFVNSFYDEEFQPPLFGLFDYYSYSTTLGNCEEEENEEEDEEYRAFEAEERFFSKFLNRKFIDRGYKRQPVKNIAIRAQTRRKYQNFRVVNKKKEEQKRKDERYCYDCLPQPSQDSSSVSTQSPVLNSTNPTSTTSPSSNAPPNSTSNGTAPPVSNTPATVPATDPASKYLTLQAERDYVEAVRQSSVDLAPTTGLSMQQMLDMCNRELTPEDYEMLLRLDEAVAKKTVNQDTLTTLTETVIEKESQLAEVCTVCMFNYELGDRVKTLPCNHFFHVDCIVPYLSSYGQSCPVCKAKV